jgi:hypothetical protein
MVCRRTAWSKSSKVSLPDKPESRYVHAKVIADSKQQTDCNLMSGKTARLVPQTPFMKIGMRAADRSFEPTFERCKDSGSTRQSTRTPCARRQVVAAFRYLRPIWPVAFFVLMFGMVAASAGEGYPNGFPNNPNFIPIGVWQQSPSLASAYKTIGINTFVGLWDGPTESQLAALAKYDMFVVASQNDVGLHSINRGIIKAWLHDDEPDNAQPIGPGLYGTCVPATEVVRRTHEMKAHDNTRPVVINFGQGVANKFWQGRGSCNGDDGYYSAAARDVDMLSFDIYPVASKTPQIKGKLEYVARGVTRLIDLAVDGQKVWAAIETTALDPEHAVTPAQVRAEVWMAIIHGARGIVYFVHEFAPTFRADAIFRHPDVVGEVAKENGLIKSLASVLNSPNLDGAIDVQPSEPIATMVKKYQNTMYIFAVAMTNSASHPRFTLEKSSGADALVVGENRSVPITGGIIEDAFGGYSVHIYEIPLIDAGN